MAQGVNQNNRLSTGIEGLDEILQGGFLSGMAYLVRGGPGCGKTTLGAEEVNRHLDPTDKIVRYGGDEYVVILPDQGTDEALTKIERVKEGVTSACYLHEEGIDLKANASFGLATFPQDAKDKKELLAAADACLFQSKARGKNRISVVTPTSD